VIGIEVVEDAIVGVSDDGKFDIVEFRGDVEQALRKIATPHIDDTISFAHGLIRNAVIPIMDNPFIRELLFIRRFPFLLIFL
jgi:hypothetical protein